MKMVKDIADDEIIFYPISRAMFTIIDREDLAKVNKGNWFAVPEGKKWRVRGYLYSDRSERKIYLHQYLLGAKGIDHINGNALDNRKSNLRVVAPRANSLNRIKLDPRNKSGYRGVSRHPLSGRWVANGWLNFKQYYLGCFDTPEEASLFVEEFYDTH